MNQFTHALVTGTGAFCVLASAVSFASARPMAPAVSAPHAGSAAPAAPVASVPSVPVQFSHTPIEKTPIQDAAKVVPMIIPSENADSIVVNVLKQEHRLTVSTSNTGAVELDLRDSHEYLQQLSKSLPIQAKDHTSPKHTTPPAKPPLPHTAKRQPSSPPAPAVHSSANVPGAPANLIPVYQAAGARYGIPWTVLAAIHKTETDFRTSNCPESSAGAKGPMQFLPATFAEYAVQAPGQSGPPNIENVNDAIYTAAHMLATNGFSKNPSRAIFAYNHSNQYVKQVETTAGL